MLRPSTPQAAFKQAIELNPENISAYSQLASLYQRTGRLEETIAAYKTALEVEPENAQMHHVLGVLYEYRGEIPLAMKEYELAISYDPSLGDSPSGRSRGASRGFVPPIPSGQVVA